MTGKGKQKTELQIEVKSQEQWNDCLQKPGLLVVDAYAGWCGPCRAIVSMFRRIKNELGDDLLNFATAETDSIESLKLYRGKSRPTFLFYGGGDLVNVIRGCNGPLLEKTIRSMLEKEHNLLDGQGERQIYIDQEVQIVAKEEKVDTPKEEPEVEEEDFEIVEVPKEITVAIIKPDAVQEGRADDIIRLVEEAGIEILQKEERVLSKEEAAEFYKQHEGSEHFEQLIEFMSSGPCLTLVLSKVGDAPGHGLIPEFRDLLGPKDINVAKEEAPNSLRAQFGKDHIQNAVHGCDSAESAARELAFFYPSFNVPTVQEKRKKKQLQRTLALVRPSALSKNKDEIIKKIEEAGFVIAMSKEMHLTQEQVEDLYSEHKEQPYFESLVKNMTSGPSLALCLAREDAVETWRNMLGPKDVSVAKTEAPDSLRAVFADEESELNPIHGADSVESAEKEIQALFPLQSTVAVIKPETYSEPEQRELVISKIREAGFHISAQKEVTLSKDLAAQFYKEHEGKEFYDQLTDYMSSGPTMFLVLSREDAIDGFRALLGPADPEVARETSPTSLRAQLATDHMKNAVHGSTDKEKVERVITDFFPELELTEGLLVKVPEETQDQASGEGSAEAPAETAATEGEETTATPGGGEVANEEGAKEGTEEATKESTEEGAKEGAEEGAKEGAEEGAKEGAEEGAKEGAEEGAKEGAEEGAKGGTEEGAKESAEEGAKEGVEEGAKDNPEEGAKETTEEGTKEGAGEETKEIQATDATAASGTNDEEAKDTGTNDTAVNGNANESGSDSPAAKEGAEEGSAPEETSTAAETNAEQKNDSPSEESGNNEQGNEQAQEPSPQEKEAESDANQEPEGETKAEDDGAKDEPSDAGESAQKDETVNPQEIKKEESDSNNNEATAT